jgi:hypothetical protein
LLLPLVLRRFDTTEIAVWLLFGIVLNLQILGDVGFTQTFTRAVAQVLGGARLSHFMGQHSAPPDGEASENSIALGDLLGTMRAVFLACASAFAILLMIGGSLALLKPIGLLRNQPEGWMAWFLVVTATSTSVWNNYYTSYLIGANEIPLVKRWEIAFGLAGVFSTLVLLLVRADCTLLELVAFQQTWVFLNCLRNRWLFHRHTQQAAIPKGVYSAELFAALWPSAWRGGLGIIMSIGLIQGSGLLFASLASPGEVAAYLLALRIMQAISQFSQVPFYSTLPTLNRLHTQRRTDEQLALAQKAMRRSHLTYCIGFFVVGIGAWMVLRAVGSHAEFVSPLMWGVMGVAFFVERLGAMHMQLYSTTNHIIWHIANGLTGALMLVMTLALFPWLRVLGFPIAMAIAYAAVYAPMAMWHSAHAFGIKLLHFERSVSLAPATAVLCYVASAAALRH